VDCAVLGDVESEGLWGGNLGGEGDGLVANEDLHHDEEIGEDDLLLGSFFAQVALQTSLTARER